MSNTDWKNWRLEKSGNVVRSLCLYLKDVKSSQVKFGKKTFDLRDDLFYGLSDALKLFCHALDEKNARWSPELSSYVWENPDKCEETLEIIASPDYRDGYYDKFGKHKTA